MSAAFLAVGRSDIGLVGLAASGGLIAVGVGISFWRGLGLERSLLWAAMRALVQLLIVGWALQLVVDPNDSLIWSGVWLLFMLAFAAWTTAQRAAGVPKVFALSLLAYALSGVVTLGVLFGFQVYELEGRTIVPLAGIVVGNSLSATVLVSRQLLEAASEQRGVIALELDVELCSRSDHPDVKQVPLVPVAGMCGGARHSADRTVVVTHDDRIVQLDAASESRHECVDLGRTQPSEIERGAKGMG